MGHVDSKCPFKTLQSIISANISQKTQFSKVRVRKGTASMLHDINKSSGPLTVFNPVNLFPPHL